ncbi:MAG: type II secretion system protein [Phycisphaeraceae bacterium]|nr:MAG: type II secretion system protein [Phycisphaeraceae bacterium]
MVVLGIVAILVGLALPALSASYGRARLTRAMSTARQAAVLVDLYTREWKDVYPIWGAGAPSARSGWVFALIDAGLAGSLDEIDPDRHRYPERSSADGGVHWLLSMGLCYDPEKMVPGQTVVLPQVPEGPYLSSDEDMPHSPIRTGDVVYPSDKGMLAPVWVTWGPLTGPWCCLPNPQPAPVPFCDLHVEALRWVECVKDGRVEGEYGIGFPVYSTWYGCRGRDRAN